MSDGVLVQVAQAMTAELLTAVKSGTFAGLTFTPERSWADWDDDVTESQGLKVDVVGINADDGEPTSRSRRRYMVVVEIYVRKKFGQKDQDQSGRIRNEQLDRLTKLMQELREFWKPFQRLVTLNEAVHSNAKIIASYSRKHMRSEGRQFFGAVQHTFETMVAIP